MTSLSAAVTVRGYIVASVLVLLVAGAIYLEVVARAVNLGFQGFASIIFTAILVVALYSSDVGILTSR